MSVTLKKEGWPEFPFNGWDSVEKWNMSHLEAIANHLEGKTRFRRQAVPDSLASGSEAKLIDRISNLEQQVFELEDVLQALLQLIDDGRPSQRLRKTARGIWEPTHRYMQLLQENTVYGVISFVALVGSVLGFLYWLATHFHWFRR
jgi:hypothetical protein